MAKLTIYEVLLAYEEPLLVLATNSKQHQYLGVNYGDGENAHLYYFARVRPKSLAQLYAQSIDVRYLITKLYLGKYEFGEMWGTEGETVITRSQETVSPAFLPQPGMFIPNPNPAPASQVRAVHIDGLWGIDDMRRFSDLVQDCYAFVYALSGKGPASAKQKISSLFHRYPWRGGFSSVNFFDDLYDLIPGQERAVIKKIRYASPGTIELNMNVAVASSIKKLVEDINGDNNRPEIAYDEVHDWLRDKGWLGKAKDDLRLTSADNRELAERLTLLASALGLSNRRDSILGLASEDLLGAVKILLAYYRRLAGLADYVATGKAQELFSEVVPDEA